MTIVITLYLTWRVLASMLLASASAYCIARVLYSYKDTRFMAGALYGVDGLQRWDRDHE
jgi:hypothetical protein